MTERSRFWDGTATGDATEAPYDAATEWSQVVRSISGTGINVNESGVCIGELSQLGYSPGSGQINILSGRAIVYGTWYENTATVGVAIPTPSGSTRVDVIVLRKSWASQTVRITRVAGTEGAGVPAITQTAGVTWDMPLYNVSITTLGVMTVTSRLLYAIPFSNANTQSTGFSGVPNGGGALDLSRSDHIHILPTANTPTTQDFGDAAVTGTGNAPAHDDHKHKLTKLFRRVKASNQAVSGGVDDNTLTFPCLINEVYIVDAMVAYVSDDITITIVCPGVVGSFEVTYHEVTTFDLKHVYVGGGANVGGDGTNRSIHFHGAFTAGSNGNCVVHYSSINTVTILSNSNLIGMQVT